jgi:hypothetical protein
LTQRTSNGLFALFESILSSETLLEYLSISRSLISLVALSISSSCIRLLILSHSSPLHAAFSSKLARYTSRLAVSFINCVERSVYTATCCSSSSMRLARSERVRACSLSREDKRERSVSSSVRYDWRVSSRDVISSLHCWSAH